MTELWLALLPLEVPTPASAVPIDHVSPQGGQGFAAYLVGGFFGLGLLILIMVLLKLQPRRGPSSRR